MTRLLVQADGVSKAYGGRTILAQAGFIIAEGERVALVGPNGAGKTTILNLITGRLSPDLGELAVDATMRWSYMSQTFEFAPEATVGSLLTTLPPQAATLKAEIEEIEARMADPAFYEEPGYEDVLSRYSELQREFQRQASKGDAGAALTMLTELGLADVELETTMRSLSGGQKTRVLLAKALANYKELDLLILDEPTNHLDIETVEWLENLLVEEYKGALLLVAHDQYLMDELATKILEIESLKVWEWEGNFTAYREQKAAYLRALEARRRREADEFKRQMQIIEEIKRRNKYDAQARSKTRRLERAQRESQGVDYSILDQKTFKLRLEATRKSSMDVLTAEGLTKRFGDVAILDNADLVVAKGDKVGLIGPNGAGKTTLLRMIVGLEKPTSGTLEISPGVKVGFFDQEHAGLDPTRTLIEEIRTIRPSPRMGDEEARGILGRFMFKGDDAFKHVAKLSGGEKARLALAKFLVGQTNLLVLDEPTNHLDLASQDVIEKALAEYQGSLLVVSHDRHFLDAVVNRIAVIAHRRIAMFPGNFSSTRTLGKLQEFLGTGDAREYLVRKSFKDFSTGLRYEWGSTLKVTGNETQTTKRLLRMAEQSGWIERKS
ncbi:MAG TPA: ABC-F family ATP-binding cassette domain-containing protein [Candidatus Thermoplasmatota archaeon]|nr:ABC-F family ATP-binding cassette domain-containing protein [Candidatus Thermoplasmatota archaeon]